MNTVLEITEELARMGQFATEKNFSKKIVGLSEMVHPAELEASMRNLETDFYYLHFLSS